VKTNRLIPILVVLGLVGVVDRKSVV